MTRAKPENAWAATDAESGQTDVRADGSSAIRTARDAIAGAEAEPRADSGQRDSSAQRAGRGRRGRKHRGERLMVPRADFQSYYGRPIVKKPTWSARDIATYLFLGGAAGASSTLAAAAELTGRHRLATAAKLGAASAIGGSLVALIHDLGRPARFLNMLRVVKVTSPMSVGSWLLAAYAPQTALAAATDVTGMLPTVGRVATIGAGVFGPAIATYTAPLISNTAVPTWHAAYREMPFLFVSSAASSAGGLAMMLAPIDEAGPARRMATAGVVGDLVAADQIHRRLSADAAPLRIGTAGRLMRAAQVLSLGGGLLGQTLGRRSRAAAVVAGAALVASSACTRFGIVSAGMASTEDPRYTVEPQRRRLAEAQAARGEE